MITTTFEVSCESSQEWQQATDYRDGLYPVDGEHHPRIVLVAQGYQITINVTGTYKYADGSIEVNASGYTDSAWGTQYKGWDWLGKSLSPLAAIAKIGENGTPFEVGLSYGPKTVQETGTLYIAVNDVAGNFDKNEGKLTFTIKLDTPDVK